MCRTMKWFIIFHHVQFRTCCKNRYTLSLFLPRVSMLWSYPTWYRYQRWIHFKINELPDMVKQLAFLFTDNVNKVLQERVRGEAGILRQKMGSKHSTIPSICTQIFLSCKVPLYVRMFACLSHIVCWLAVGVWNRVIFWTCVCASGGGGGGASLD